MVSSARAPASACPLPQASARTIGTNPRSVAWRTVGSIPISIAIPPIATPTIFGQTDRHDPEIPRLAHGWFAPNLNRDSADRPAHNATVPDPKSQWRTLKRRHRQFVAHQLIGTRCELRHDLGTRRARQE